MNDKATIWMNKYYALEEDYVKALQLLRGVLEVLPSNDKTLIAKIEEFIQEHES